MIHFYCTITISESLLFLLYTFLVKELYKMLTVKCGNLINSRSRFAKLVCLNDMVGTFYYTADIGMKTVGNGLSLRHNYVV